YHAALCVHCLLLYTRGWRWRANPGLKLANAFGVRANMAQAVVQVSAPHTHAGVRMAVVPWVITAVDYFYQYALRSAPAVMMPELSNAFGLTPLGVASIVGLF